MPSNVTPVAPVKFVPTMVTIVEPVVGPDGGARPVMTGPGTGTVVVVVVVVGSIVVVVGGTVVVVLVVDVVDVVVVDVVDVVVVGSPV